MLVVCDTNVIVSALLWRGPTAAVHRAWVEGRCSLALGRAVLDEYRRVLAAPKFGLMPDDVSYLLDQEILPFGAVFPDERLPSGSWIPDDPADDEFIRLALASEAAALVSGDRHILSAADRLPCRVLAVPAFLAGC